MPVSLPKGLEGLRGACRAVIQAAGIQNADQIPRSPNPHNVVKANTDAPALRDVADVARLRGKTVEEVLHKTV